MVFASTSEQYKVTAVVQIGNGGPCGHQWCCERSELADPRLVKISGNKELLSGEKYTAAVRCYVNPDAGSRIRKRSTERLFTTSGYIEPVITETVNQDKPATASIAGGSAAALLLLVFVIVGIICYRKRQTNDDQNFTGLQIGLKTITVDDQPNKEATKNPSCTALDEDSSPYETTIYSIADLVTVDDVVEFLRAKGFGQYAAAFNRHKVDGEGAMSLTYFMLAELVPEIGPRAKLYKAFQELKDNPDSTESRRPAHSDWEIPRSSLTLGKILGKGQFGEVRMGELRKRGVTQTVAVKTLKAYAEERDKEDLKGELDILVTVGRHDNIISLVGACTVEGPLTLVVEYAPNGCLKDWLKNNRPKELNQTDDKTIATGIQLPMDQLIMFGIDIANGMSHLAAMQCVHRDLAARNVLLGQDLTAKISDFGLSRDIYEESEYVKSTKSQLPVRWIAYESLFYHVYTTQSDVWSFGILLWEIITMGKKPYGRMTGKELMKLLPDGYRLEKPALCPQDVYDVMKSCWETLPENRPTFPQLKTTLDRISQNYKTYASLLK
ncbi:fibroblast growth factor receptor 3-like [Branchiostoma lanceolatum]|uniref:fibroblast growth factor receptor 3-like n=1 Tax=Branchiostoma lanceolatum TaxID=7740 RepID=UPI0034522242